VRHQRKYYYNDKQNVNKNKQKAIYKTHTEVVGQTDQFPWFQVRIPVYVPVYN